VERLGIDARRPNGRFAFTSVQADRIRRALGVTPQVDGLSRSETVVLAALRSAPFGLVSTRAAGRRSGLAPTSAGRALESLLAKGLVERAAETIAVGRTRETIVWRANVAHPRWPAIDTVLDRVRRPERRRCADRYVPRRLRHLFWNTARDQLDLSRAGPYIARRLLLTMDLQGLAWGSQALAASDWEEAARGRGLDARARRLAQNLAGAAQ
jgi:MarR family